jgi:hypothetical protein
MQMACCFAPPNRKPPRHIDAMKHAGAACLDALEPMLEQLRAIEGLKEKSRGTFYRKSKAFLHFHEDPAGFFADVKLGDDFVRLPVNTRTEIATLIRSTKRALATSNG